MEKYYLELLIKALRRRSLSRKTENAYVNHIRHFIEFDGNRDLEKAGAGEISAFLLHLERDLRFAAATQRQAAYALQFFYREVFGREMPDCLIDIKRTPNADKLPVVLTTEEVRAVLSHLRGLPYLIAALIYGSGLRLQEALNLRIGDVDFQRREITVRDPRTGAKNHTTILPGLIVRRLQKHLVEVRFLHEDDCLRGFGKVALPAAVECRQPEAVCQWRWQYVFPALKLSRNKSSGGFYRNHLGESGVQKALSEAVEKAKVLKKACCQTLRHSFAVRLFEKNHDLYTVGNLLGHKNLRTTLVYSNVVARSGRDVLSPLDV
jgi:integron integrase